LEHTPERIRVSLGTAAALGLKRIRVDADSTTAYLMSYTEQPCAGNCAFCAQARNSIGDHSQLSRVLWPDYQTDEVLSALNVHSGSVRRICIQVINYPGFITDVTTLIQAIRSSSSLPVSVDTCPIKRRDFLAFKKAGAEKVGVPIDAATPTLFDSIKGRSAGGPYRWEAHLAALKTAKKIFGPENVMTNLIVGLGETEREAVEFIQTQMDNGIKTALFAFTPLRGTSMEKCAPPSLSSYRRIQLARYLITAGATRYESMKFSPNGKLTSFGTNAPLLNIVGDGEAFRTSGCPDCNRPYYNERPRGPMYNYPRPLKPAEAVEEIKKMEVEKS